MLVGRLQDIKNMQILKHLGVRTRGFDRNLHTINLVCPPGFLIKTAVHIN